MTLQLMRLLAIAQNSNSANLVGLGFYGIGEPPNPSMFSIWANRFLCRTTLWNRSICSVAAVFFDSSLLAIDRMVIVSPNICAPISMEALGSRHFRPTVLIVLQRCAAVQRSGSRTSTGIPIQIGKVIHFY